MYKALESFTTKNYDVRRGQILAEDFTTQDEITEFLNIGYIVEYDGSLEITENGTYDVKDYEQAVVDVSGGGGGLDWSAIGYSGTPEAIIDGYNYAKKIQEEWTPTSKLTTNYKDILICPFVDVSDRTTLSSFANDCKRLIQLPRLDTSNTTDMSAMFNGCSSLTTVPQFDTSKVTTMNGMFQSCSMLATVPKFDTSNVGNMGVMFGACSSLTTVPQFDTSKVTTMNNMFQSCTKLSDESLNNILAMCINATTYTGTKTLKQLGIKDTTLKNKIPTLSNYQAFLEAGWTIGS